MEAISREIQKWRVDKSADRIGRIETALVEAAEGGSFDVPLSLIREIIEDDGLMLCLGRVFYTLAKVSAPVCDLLYDRSLRAEDPSVLLDLLTALRKSMGRLPLLRRYLKDCSSDDLLAQASALENVFELSSAIPSMDEYREARESRAAWIAKSLHNFSQVLTEDGSPLSEHPDMIRRTTQSYERMMAWSPETILENEAIKKAAQTHYVQFMGRMIQAADDVRMHETLRRIATDRLHIWFVKVDRCPSLKRLRRTFRRLQLPEPADERVENWIKLNRG